MLRSRAFAVLAALVVPSLFACSAEVRQVDISDDPTGEPPPSSTTPPASTTPPPPAPPEKVTFDYSSVSLPGANLSIASIGGSSKNDVWVVAKESGAGQNDPWSAYHYDGSKWSSVDLSTPTGRPSFGVASLAGKTYFGFSYSAELFELAGSAFTKKAGWSVTSGYAMAAVGSKIYVGTQENFGSGPLYAYDGVTSKQVSVKQGQGGVVGIWAASDGDVWLARSGGIGHLSNGAYETVDTTPVHAVSGSAADDVWAIGKDAVMHYDGKAWSEVAWPGGSSDEPRTLAALAKDEVIIGTYSNVYRYDGKAFAKESRASAPKAASAVGRIGKDEAWFVTSTQISRLAPKGK
ncbi:MAG: hypothetical protein KF819_29380 [Labilithrix sp.]|nr:hypothetical protein [Labilithrix sp.]